MRRALLLTFDVEEFDLPREMGRMLDRDSEFAITESGVAAILPLLARHGVRATFFVTASFAAARTQCVRAISAAGHEVAAHGLVHADDYTSMNDETAITRLRRARALLEQIAAAPVRGFRAPRLRPPSCSAIRAAGFEYDASVHPTWMPGRYNGLHFARTPWDEDGLVRIPISVLPLARLPVSWLWFRTMGTPLNLAAAAAASLSAPYLHLYFHPWEAIDIRAHLPQWVAWRTGDPFVRALDRLLQWAQPRFTARTVGEQAAELVARTLPAQSAVSD